MFIQKSNRCFRKPESAIVSFFLTALLLILMLAGCSPATSSTATAPITTLPPIPQTTTPDSTTTSSPANSELILSSTTSTRDSGLMEVLLPIFEKKTGYKVKPIYNGSGAAMALGEKGEADVLLVHAPDSEVKFMEAGHGAARKLVMHNDFVIVGPANDPAGIKGSAKAIDALTKISAAGSPFYSRGDNSGTDQLEKKLWKTAGITQTGQSWYFEAKLGMADLLRVASEKSAYSITDRATYLANKSMVNLDILVQGDPALLNIYHVIQINPAKSALINGDGAKAFAEFMVDTETQAIIAKFGVEKYGQPLFFADAGKSETDLGSK